MRNFLSQKRGGWVGGFTAIEIILTLAISATLTIVAALSVAVLFETQARMGAERELREQGMQIVNLITKEIRNADTVSTPLPSEEDETLALLPFGETGETIIFLRDGKLWLSEGGGPEVALTNSRVRVEEFIITNLADPGEESTIQIDLRLVAPLLLPKQNAVTGTFTLRTSATMRSSIATP